MYIGSLENTLNEPVLSVCIDYNKPLGRVSETVSIKRGRNGHVIGYVVTERRIQLNPYNARLLRDMMDEALKWSESPLYNWAKRKTGGK